MNERELINEREREREMCDGQIIARGKEGNYKRNLIK